MPYPSISRILPAAPLLFAALTGVAADAAPGTKPDAVPRSTGARFAIATSGEWAGEHPKLFPVLGEAGVQMVRYWPEWQQIQPAKGEWKWDWADRVLASADASGMEMYGVLAYLAPWASSGGDTRTFPLKDIADWSTYTGTCIGKYKDKVRYWEVYNEFNGGFATNGTPKDYGELVAAAFDAGKKANPECRIGIGCADVDVTFLEQAITNGAAGKFDFLVVHPYSLMAAAMNGREGVFLRLSSTVRSLLKRTGQREDIELVVSEVGQVTRNEPAGEQVQAEAVVKAFALCQAQGITRTFWFEGRGPDYGTGGDFGLIRRDWSKRPSFDAMRNLVRLFGKDGQRIGWWNPTGKSYGFVFQGAQGPLAIAWAIDESGDALKLPGQAAAGDIFGKPIAVAPGAALPLTRTPVIITGLPADLVAEAKANAAKPFPWLKDFSAAGSVSVQMGASNVFDGVTQCEQGDGLTKVGLVDGIYARRLLRERNSDYMYFDVDDSYAAAGDADLEVTLVVRPVDRAAGARFNLTYEGTKGYRDTKESWKAADQDGWQTATFKLPDAHFANNWGWNFRIRMSGAPGNVWVKEVTVKRAGPRK